MTAEIIGKKSHVTTGRRQLGHTPGQIHENDCQQLQLKIYSCTEVKCYLPEHERSFPLHVPFC